MKFAQKLVRPVVASRCWRWPRGVAFAQKGETVKIAFIDPLSGLIAPTSGQNQLKSWQFVAEQLQQEQPGRREVRDRRLSTTRLSPQESLNALQGGHRPGHPLRRAGQRLGRGAGHHRRGHQAQRAQPRQGGGVPQLRRGRPRPDQRASAASGTSASTPTPSMKMEALTTFMKDQPDVKKVYLINQNYSHGQQVAKYAKEMPGAQAPRRPDRRRRPAPARRRCKDFAPYVAKIKQSGADTVITGNWGPT